MENSGKNHHVAMGVLIDVLMVFIVNASMLSILLLCCSLFKVDIVLILSLFSSYLTFRPFQKALLSYHSSKFSYKNHGLFILILLMISFIIASAPYFYIRGGQDEGVYVNAAATFERTGKIFQDDDIRKNIGNNNILKIYDKYNFRDRKIIVHGKYEGVFLPGIYVKDIEQSEYVFQFYPLHPIWMSIFGKIFGGKNRVYSLVFFSLISVLFFYLLFYELFANKWIAFTAGLLLALNPLHAFFSKFPVTEVVFLSFTLSCFFYLVRYYELAKKGIYCPFYLLLAVGLIGCSFFTRISGFMYLPFFYSLTVLTILFVGDKRIRVHLLFSFFGVFLIYIMSLIYGLNFSYPYSHDIYTLSIGKILGNNWGFKVCLICILALLFLLVVSLTRTA